MPWFFFVFLHHGHIHYNFLHSYRCRPDTTRFRVRFITAFFLLKQFYYQPKEGRACTKQYIVLSPLYRSCVSPIFIIIICYFMLVNFILFFVFCVSSIFLWFQYLVYIQWIPYSITLETLLYFLLTLLSSGFYSETIISASLSRLECNREALRNDVLNHRIIVCEVDLHMQRKSIIFDIFQFVSFVFNFCQFFVRPDRPFNRPPPCRFSWF